MLKNRHQRLMPLIVAGILGWSSSAISADPQLVDVTYGEGALAFSAGFIRQSVVSEGIVAKTPDNKTVLGKGDLVYLRMNHLADVAPGSLYTLYRRSQKVFHPGNRRYLGELINVMGIVRIAKISHEFAIATIERSYGPIVPGNGVMPFALPQEQSGAADRSFPEVPGMIVEMEIQRTLVAQNHKVYLDWGREDGLAVGDRLEVFRVRAGQPDRPVGEVKVVALEDRTATGLIVRSTTQFALGDRFIIKETASHATHQGAQSTKDHPTHARTNARQTLSQSLGAEIARGDVSVTQEGDKIRINLGDLVDQLEYESGHAPIKPSGLKILKQISDILKTMTDQQIQIEGHTDNMVIGPSLVSRFATNQELSEARANLIVRYFMEEGLDPSSLSAVGYADRRPVTSNATEDGRRKNRRIEIELSPKTPAQPILAPLSSNQGIGGEIVQDSPNDAPQDTAQNPVDHIPAP
jgi:chemotaxis protein MotB